MPDDDENQYIKCLLEYHHGGSMASKMPQYIRLKQRFRCTSDMYASKEKQVKVDVIHFRSTIVWALARFQF